MLGVQGWIRVRVRIKIMFIFNFWPRCSAKVSLVLGLG
jgi:hypothetical protein